MAKGKSSKMTMWQSEKVAKVLETLPLFHFAT
jgi:hypothetical protein